MPACKCFLALGRCPAEELMARVAALEVLRDKLLALDALWEAGGPEPAAGDHKGKQVPYPGQQQRDSRTAPICPLCGEDHDMPAPEQAATPAQQPRSCETCNHVTQSAIQLPCRHCEDKSAWQPREGGGA